MSSLNPKRDYSLKKYNEIINLFLAIVVIVSLFILAIAITTLSFYVSLGGI